MNADLDDVMAAPESMIRVEAIPGSRTVKLSFFDCGEMKLQTILPSMVALQVCASIIKVVMVAGPEAAP